MNFGFWLRWSWRDLKARWVQVVVIAIIIALGTGVFAGLGGQETWRTDSYDKSYQALNMYDLRIELASGSYLNGDQFAGALKAIEGIQRVETRLITPTLVDASQGGETILVRGRLIGVDVRGGGPQVNRLFVDQDSGRTLTEADSGENIAVVEYKFARVYDLKPPYTIHISGDQTLQVVGNGHSPEYFMVVPDTASFFAEATFAAVFLPLETAQKITGRDGLVNDVVLSLQEGADRETVRQQIEAVMAQTFPQTGLTLTETEDDYVYATLYSDAEGDQFFWNIIAVLFLVGAAMGAFNLASRMVEAQRREIGISMALGVPRWWIAFRPLLVGIQIAILGTLFGLVMGYGLGQLFASQLESLVPLPYYVITFYLPGYIQATLVGILLPFIATLIPVWRAVRVPPIDAIKSGYLVAKGGGWSWLANYLPLPGRSFTQMPIRNVLRSPWRTLLTVLGIAIAVTMITFIVGALDTFLATVDVAEEAYRYTAGDRVLVNLDFFYPLRDGEISGIESLTNADGQSMFSHLETALVLGGTLKKDGEEIETMLEFHDMESAIWTPKLIEGTLVADEPAIIISEKAARDLGISVGDTLTLEHPLREGLFSFRLTESQIKVGGIHNNPLRPLTYLDMSRASMMGLEGVTNLVIVEPAAGVSNDDIKRALLTQPGVASVEPVSEFSDAVDRLLELATVMFGIISLVAVALAFLIAFNSTSISVDERVREIATMFAFGLPIRTVTRMQMLENVLIGVLGTLLGVAIGWLVIIGIFQIDYPQLEDIQMTIAVSETTYLLAFGVGVVVVALTPLLSVRRMRRMDIPSTLRVME
jgi:putative ABC transport system permease protein